MTRLGCANKRRQLVVTCSSRLFAEDEMVHVDLTVEARDYHA
jgi:hypothetical protein